MIACPRCKQPTDRERAIDLPAVGFLAMNVAYVLPLICSACLNEWDRRVARGTFLAVPIERKQT